MILKIYAQKLFRVMYTVLLLLPQIMICVAALHYFEGKLLPASFCRVGSHLNTVAIKMSIRHNVRLQ